MSATKAKSYDSNADPLDVYVSENSLREHPVLKELHAYTLKNVERSMMISDPVEVQFFRMLLKMLNAKKCIEVGTFTGYNVLSCALTIPEDGVVYALDINENYVQHGYPFFEKANVKDKIKVQIGPALDSMDTLIKDGHGETFDFIYVDADKLGYGNYVERAYLLLRIGGLVVLDNMLQRGRVANLSQQMPDGSRPAAEYVHKLNQELKKDKRFQISFLNVADGVTILRKISEEERSQEYI